ncbi:uncharacterized protein A4U43_C02F10820 [Asparagus officinalis]|uniref:Uncharacterized protein n=1 Tax=Asparagus officinalis TaxID=4686 RepID=A0A5P1FLG9_ASPOF|nr:uncharacterized protein A4U43_C02F10820 [Asparagus officinalis]
MARTWSGVTTAVEVAAGGDGERGCCLGGRSGSGWLRGERRWGGAGGGGSSRGCGGAAAGAAEVLQAEEANAAEEEATWVPDWLWAALVASVGLRVWWTRTRGVLGSVGGRGACFDEATAVRGGGRRRERRRWGSG